MASEPQNRRRSSTAAPAPADEDALTEWKSWMSKWRKSPSPRRCGRCPFSSGLLATAHQGATVHFSAEQRQVDARQLPS